MDALWPAGGTSGPLDGNHVNESATGAGTLARQLLAATFNREYSEFGCEGMEGIAHLLIANGEFEGWTVDQVIAFANEYIGGNTDLLGDSLDASDLTDVLTNINENFDDCEDSQGDLIEPDVPIFVEIGDHFCLQFCLEDDEDDDSSTVRIYWCCPLNGPPVFTWQPGCDPEFTDCDNDDCDPFEGEIEWSAQIDSVGAGCDGTWWSATFIAREDEDRHDDDDDADRGCICVFFEFQLSVELLDFSALAGNDEVTLEWATASERSNSRFELRRSANGSAWTTIGHVNGQGTVAHTTNYSFVDDAVDNGVNYRYRLVSVDAFGQASEVGSEVLATPSTNGAVPLEFALHQNFPNPFNPSTTISFDVAEAGHVSLSVYDLNGREVATLVNRNLAANSYTVSFDATALPSGTYFYRLEAGSFTAMQKMLLLK